MATTVATLTGRVRRFLHDWPDQDVTTASLSSTVTSVTVADTTIYSPNWQIQVDSEVMIVRALASATSLTVARGAYGSTAAVHVTASDVLLNPAWTDLDILDALNAGIAASFPLIYKEVTDDTTTAVASTYEYTVPSTLPYLTEVAYKTTGGLRFGRPIRTWQLLRGSSPKILFRSDLYPGTIRFRGFGPFDPLTIGGSLDAQWPVRAEYPLVMFAGQYLLASGEAGRVRFDRGPVDTREQATRTGSSMAAANGVYQRFQAGLSAVAPPPMPRWTVSVI